VRDPFSRAEGQKPPPRFGRAQTLSVRAPKALRQEFTPPEWTQPGTGADQVAPIRCGSALPPPRTPLSIDPPSNAIMRRPRADPGENHEPRPGRQVEDSHLTHAIRELRWT
jgi:hypothetical protein